MLKKKTDGRCISFRKNELNAITIDATDIPDLVPILSLVASVSNGTTVIKGAERLRFKESDRLKSVSSVLNALGADITETDDGLIIKGVSKLRGGCVDSFNDHRIAMSCAIASVICENEVQISGAECVKKSYPAFFEDFKKLGGVASVSDR